MTHRKPNTAPNRVPYGSIKKLVQTLLEAGVSRYELDTEAMDIPNPSGYYNSCFQAAKRSGFCRAYKQGAKIIFVRNQAAASV